MDNFEKSKATYLLIFKNMKLSLEKKGDLLMKYGIMLEAANEVSLPLIDPIYIKVTCTHCQSLYRSH